MSNSSLAPACPLREEFARRAFLNTMGSRRGATPFPKLRRTEFTFPATPQRPAHLSSAYSFASPDVQSTPVERQMERQQAAALQADLRRLREETANSPKASIFRQLPAPIAESRR